MGRPRAGRVAEAAAAVAAFAALAFLAAGLTGEMVERRRAGFCRSDPGIPGAVTFEERTWWPLGERCFLRLADGATRVREPRWWLTAFAGGWVAAVAVGVPAPARSPRRALAWAAAVPLVPVAALVLVTVTPRSLSRLLGLAAVSLGFGLLPGAATAAGVWFLARGRLLPTVLGSWLVWAALMFWQGRDAIGP